MEYFLYGFTFGYLITTWLWGFSIRPGKNSRMDAVAIGILWPLLWPIIWRRFGGDINDEGR